MLRNEVDIVAVLVDEGDNNLAALAVCGAGRALDACGGQIAGVGLVVTGKKEKNAAVLPELLLPLTKV